MSHRRWAAPGLFVIALALALAPAGHPVGQVQGSQTQGGAPPPAGAQAQAAPPQTPPAVPAEGYFKNIQIFKGMPASQIIPAMNFMAASLGVQCTFCHVSGEGDFDKDDKPAKKTAREMYTMMVGINKDSFKGVRRLTCNSCHNGHQEPVAIPLVAAERPAPPPPPPPPSAANPAGATATPPPTVDQILDKYIQALGGREAIEKINSRVASGEVRLTGGQEFGFEQDQKMPGLQVVLIRLPNGDLLQAQGFDGTTYWEAGPGASQFPPDPWQTARAKRTASPQSALHLKESYPRLRLGRVEKIGDRQAYLVIGFPQGDSPARFYFDVQTGLLDRTVAVIDTPVGISPTQVDFEDYRAVDGVQVPFHLRISRLDTTLLLQLSDVKQNVPVDDAKFAKPAAK